MTISCSSCTEMESCGSAIAHNTQKITSKIVSSVFITVSIFYSDAKLPPLVANGFNKC